MEHCWFSMTIQKKGILKYVLLAVVPSFMVGILLGIESASFVFIFLAAFLIMRRNHSIVVFQNYLTEKDHRGKLMRRIQTSQISHYTVNFLNEIILMDNNCEKLICVESNSTNRDRFEQWLAAHHIERK